MDIANQWEDFDWGDMRPEIEECVASLEINEDNLSYAASMQPLLIMKAGAVLAWAKNNEALLKNAKEQELASADISVRGSSPDEYGFAKWTETSIKATVAADIGVIEATNNAMSSAYQATFAQMLFSAMCSKTGMIDSLVRMRVSTAYASTTDPESVENNVNTSRGR